MLQAMNTGHEGSLTTVHANTPRDALARIENMCSMANLNIPERAMRHQIAAAIHAVVQVTRLSDGTRKVITIAEVTGMEGEVICMQDIFVSNARESTRREKCAANSVRSGFAPSSPTVWPRQAAASGPRCSNRRWRFRTECQRQASVDCDRMFILIALAVFVVVALAVFVIASLMDERSSKARLLRERLSTVQKTPERDAEPGTGIIAR